MYSLVDTIMSLRYTSKPGMRIPNIDPELRKIADKLIRNGKKAYLVGGAVRDAFLKRPVTDFDIATDAMPQECMRLFPWAIPTGIQHGTITVIPRSRRYKVEITTFRTEGAYTDGRHPDTVAFVDDISLDLSRRDFTINAMAFDLAHNVFVDPFGGKRDLADRIVRAVGSPLDRFHEDGLRTIRAIRFASQLGFVIEPATFSAIAECRGGLIRISAERIRDEFSKILEARIPSVGLQFLVDTGTVEAIVPELLACRGVPQPNHGHQDVLAHLFATTDAVIPDNLSEEELLVLRLAALFHDIGKPLCYRDDNDSVSFYGHEMASEKIARKRLQELKYSNSVIEKVCHLVRHHMFNYEPGWTDAAVRRFIARVGLQSIRDLFALRLADSTATTGGPSSWPLLSEFQSRIDRVVEAHQALSLKDLAVNGDDLAALGIPRSREMGALLSELLDAALEDPSLNTKEKMLKIAQAKYFSLKR
jgi:tRNA nucleotidyltransferase (CCA-adding enzyme)